MYELLLRNVLRFSLPHMKLNNKIAANGSPHLFESE